MAGSSRLFLPILLAMALLPRPIAAQQAAERMVFLEREGLLVGLPLPAVAGVIRRWEWAPTGRHLLAIRLAGRSEEMLLRGMPLQSELMVWDRSTGRARGFAPAGGRLEWKEAAWFPRGDAVAAIGQPLPALPPGAPAPREPIEPRLFRLSVPGGTIHDLGPTEPSDRPIPLPGGEVLLFRPGASLRVVGPDGRTRQLALPASVQAIAVARRLSEVHIQTIAVGGRRPGASEWLRFDSRTGQLVGSPGPGEDISTSPSPEFALKRSRFALRETTTVATTYPLWLISRTNSPSTTALVTPNCHTYGLGPARDAVAFADDSGLLVVELSRLPRAVVEAARAAASRVAALNAAKQVAIAALLYADEHDGQLPAAGDDLLEKLGKFLGDGEQLEGVQITFAGGKLSGVERPSETVMGHIRAPGGKVVFFVDGHVVWEADGEQ